MTNFKLETPWNTFQKQVNALFEQDDDIIVNDIEPSDREDVNYVMSIEVRDHEKFLALDRVIPKVKRFGNILLEIQIFDEENTLLSSGIDIYKTIFKGNPIVDEVHEALDLYGISHGFVIFKPEVVQFFDDDISDINGNWNGLAEDIAREVFEDDMSGVHFCTAAK